MKTREERLFRVPIDELRALIKSQHGVDLSSIEPFIDGDSIVFAVQVARDKSESVEVAEAVETSSETLPRRNRLRRTRRKRNRVKTRGWKVVGRIRNSQGLMARIYEPFVTALRGVGLSRREKQKLVRQIMLGNGNRPTESSVDYYLQNTLQYIESKQNGPNDSLRGEAS